MVVLLSTTCQAVAVSAMTVWPASVTVLPASLLPERVKPAAASAALTVLLLSPE